MATSLAYQGEWTELSKAIRRRQPWCSFCRAEEGETYIDKAGHEQAVWLTVDHIDGNTQNNEPANLRVLCTPCHGSLTSDGWRR